MRAALGGRRSFICPKALCFCRRLGDYELPNGRRLIIPLIEQEVVEWTEGENPFTPDGRELVQPVKAKTHWRELTRSYD